MNPNLKTDLIKSRGFYKRRVKAPLDGLENKVWRWFSIYIRLRKANVKGYVRCVTCPKVLYWKLGDAGHFIPGRHKIILFDERGCHFQCRDCNRKLAGNYKKYEAFMRKVYGQAVIDELKNLDLIVMPFMPQELKKLLIKYRSKAKQLLKKHGQRNS